MDEKSLKNNIGYFRMINFQNNCQRTIEVQEENEINIKNGEQDEDSENI